MREVFRLPDVGEGIAEAEIVEYLVKVGDTVKADEPVVRIETDKAVVELPTPFGGTVAEIPHSPGDTVQVGDPLLIVETEGKAEAAPSRQKKEEAPSKREKAPIQAKEEVKLPEKAPADKKVLATPRTRKVARELGVDIREVTGTGPRGRITEEDVRLAASKAKEKAEPKRPKGPTAAAVQAPSTAGFDFEKYGPTERKPLKGVRKRTAEVMARSVSTIPHVTHFDEADVTELLEVKTRKKALAEERGIKLTLLAFVAKAAADALRKFPQFNSSLDEDTGEIVFKHYYNLGFATDTESGLMVPVIKDVDRKSILDIAADLNELARKARDRSIGLEDMRGGTFTITNVGALSGMWATPIIVHPEVAILCTLKATKKPVVRNDEIVVRSILPLTLSFDHRVLDGADAARFMQHVKELLEDPMRMLLDMA